MTRSPIIVAVLKKNNAVEDFRKLIGSTNPEDAEKGTVRKLFATSMGENAIHGSDSEDNAHIESSFFLMKMRCIRSNNFFYFITSNFFIEIFDYLIYSIGEFLFQHGRIYF